METFALAPFEARAPFFSDTHPQQKQNRRTAAAFPAFRPHVPMLFAVRVRHWFAGARSGWPLIVVIAIFAAGIGYTIAPAAGSPLTPEFSFKSGTDAIEASGALPCTSQA
jgi:hypothetical protein